MSLVDFNLAVDSNFDIRGVDAEYFPQGGPMVPVKVIKTRPAIEAQFGASGFRLAAEKQVDAETVDIRLSELPLARKNDRIVITGAEFPYRVKSEPVLDRMKLVWHLDLVAET